MSMAWNARLKAAWRGEVSNADLSAMFAATSSLTKLQQALDDRRLAAEIEHTGHDWRAVLAVGQIAAPLWLADALVSLADSLYDAETRSHADRPSSVNPYIHDLVAALLAPVEDIIADVTAALADPRHRPALTAPLHVGPSGDIAEGDPPDPISLPYAQGLSAGAVRLHTSASAVLMSLQAAIARSESPNWLAAGIQRLDGELQAAGARLDMSGVRLASLVGTHNGDPAALAEICRDLWLIIGASVVAGQVLSDPHLLPEAAAAAQSSPRTPPQSPSRTPPPPVAPPAVTTTPMAPPPAPVERVVLPNIDAGAAPLRPHREALSPDPRSPAPPADVALPVIGEPAQPPPPDPAPPNKPQRDPPRRSEAPASEADDKPTVLFPDIG